MHKGMPKVNLKTYFKKIMLSLSLYCHVFSVGMQLMSDFRLVLGGHRDSRDSSFTALLASNLLAQFSRQIVIQILGLESPKVCGNLAARPL
jgi:hypothetical protein